MGKRYYCDYCDKSFADNASNRRNHLVGTFHQRQKKAHYDSFIKIDPAKMLAESAQLPLCHSFRATGECRYGNNCRYSHLTEEVKRELKQQVVDAHAERRAASQRARLDEENAPTVAEWLEKRKLKKLTTDGDASEPAPPDNWSEVQLPLYNIPPVLANYPSLPPSLVPPPPDVFKYLPLEEWG